jgi:2-iminoacetate synthase ThiH
MDEIRDEVRRHKKRPHEVAHLLFGEDTSPEVERFLLDAYRKMSGAEKIARVRALNSATIALALANIRKQHPDASEREVLLRLAVRRYGADFVREHLGWDAEKEGD